MGGCHGRGRFYRRERTTSQSTGRRATICRQQLLRLPFPCCSSGSLLDTFSQMKDTCKRLGTAKLSFPWGPTLRTLTP